MARFHNDHQTCLVGFQSIALTTDAQLRPPMLAKWCIAACEVGSNSVTDCPDEGPNHGFERYPHYLYPCLSIFTYILWVSGNDVRKLLICVCKLGILWIHWRSSWVPLQWRIELLGVCARFTLTSGVGYGLILRNLAILAQVWVEKWVYNFCKTDPAYTLCLC